MANITFENNIKPILTSFGGCMKNVVVTDEEGSVNLDLSDYEIVKRFYYKIQVAIHGYDFDSNGHPLPGAMPLLVKEGKDKGQYVVAPHPMPPGGSKRRLNQDDINTYDRWVENGMPE